MEAFYIYRIFQILFRLYAEGYLISIIFIKSSRKSPKLVLRYRKLENFSKLIVQNVNIIFYLVFTLLITMNQHKIYYFIFLDRITPNYVKLRLITSFYTLKSLFLLHLSTPFYNFYHHFTPYYIKSFLIFSLKLLCVITPNSA